MAGEKTYDGKCFCGDVALKVTGEPVAMGYCHCTSCREWSAGPINAFSLWKPELGAHYARRRQRRQLRQELRTASANGARPAAVIS